MSYLTRFLRLFLFFASVAGALALTSYISAIAALLYGDAYGLLVEILGVCALAAAFFAVS
jgi:hypothetical protein